VARERVRAADHADGLPAHLERAVHAAGLEQREAALSAAYGALAERHNASGLTEPLDPGVRSFHARPAQVLMADRFAGAASRPSPILPCGRCR
jgi:hypothetical protein